MQNNFFKILKKITLINNLNKFIKKNLNYKRKIVKYYPEKIKLY